MQKSFLYLCLPWYLSIVQGYLCIDLRRDNTLDPRNVDQNNWHLKTFLGPIFQVLVRRWRLRSLTYWIQYFQRTTDKRDHLIYAYIEYVNCYLEILNKSDSFWELSGVQMFYLEKMQKLVDYYIYFMNYIDSSSFHDFRRGSIYTCNVYKHHWKDCRSIIPQNNIYQKLTWSCIIDIQSTFHVEYTSHC